MSDPFLRAHHVAPRVFNMGGRLTPVSIKDQMIRARLFVDRACETGEISSQPDHHLMIVGGGICGVTAAIRAAERGVPATVLERSPRLFFLQAGCQTRWVDPTQYDWPLAHWRRGRFPWAGPSMPLVWKSDWAHRLALIWWLQLQAAVANFPRLLRFYVSSQLQAGGLRYIPPNKISVQCVVGQSRLPNPSGTYGAVLVTTGFGTENTTVTATPPRQQPRQPNLPPPSYRGYAFWQTDKLSPSKIGAKAKVLISGAGDGALQDFLRVTTGLNSAIELLQLCRIPKSIAARLKDVERKCAYLYHWGDNRWQDHPVHERLDEAHLQEVKRVLAKKQYHRVGTALDRLLKPWAKDVRLLHSCTHLTPFYALNRFVTLLIAEYARRKWGDSLVDPNYSLIESQSTVAFVDSAHHQPCRSPATCHGQLHEVTAIPAPICWNRPAVPVPLPSPRKFDVVIIRHGVLPASNQITPVTHPRQIIPYHLL